MRYTKAERELAADLCQMAASNGPTAQRPRIGMTTWDAAFSMRALYARESKARETKEWRVANLADLAWRHVAWVAGPRIERRAERYAEAEARLRTGWLP